MVSLTLEEGKQSIEHIPVSLSAYLPVRLVNVPTCVYLFNFKAYN